MSHRPHMVAVARRFFVLLVLAVGGAGPALAQPSLSANYVGQGCRDLLSHVPRSFTQGMCLGAIDVLIDLAILMPGSPMFCPPAGSSQEQLVRFIVDYLDRNPGKGAGPFSLVALEALREAWPCR